MQALIRAELNSAKGALYDELRVKAERSEAECQRLLVVEATFKRLELQSVEADKHHRQKEHSVEMLQMDKAYLTKQVEQGRTEEGRVRKVCLSKHVCCGPWVGSGDTAAGAQVERHISTSGRGIPVSRRKPASSKAGCLAEVRRAALSRYGAP